MAEQEKKRARQLRLQKLNAKTASSPADALDTQVSSSNTFINTQSTSGESDTFASSATLTDPLSCYSSTAFKITKENIDFVRNVEAVLSVLVRASPHWKRAHPKLVPVGSIEKVTHTDSETSDSPSDSESNNDNNSASIHNTEDNNSTEIECLRERFRTAQKYTFGREFLYRYPVSPLLGTSASSYSTALAFLHEVLLQTPSSAHANEHIQQNSSSASPDNWHVEADMAFSSPDLPRDKRTTIAEIANQFGLYTEAPCAWNEPSSLRSSITVSNVRLFELDSDANVTSSTSPFKLESFTLPVIPQHRPRIPPYLLSHAFLPTLIDSDLSLSHSRFDPLRSIVLTIVKMGSFNARNINVDSNNNYDSVDEWTVNDFLIPFVRHMRIRKLNGKSDIDYLLDLRNSMEDKEWAEFPPSVFDSEWVLPQNKESEPTLTNSEQ